jgi:hypothetical protein
MKFWGMVFLVATSLVAVLKHERAGGQRIIILKKLLIKVS